MQCWSVEKNLERQFWKLILQLASSKGWDNIESFDIKAAFLRGQEQGDRLLGIEPTAELRERLKLKPNEILQSLKGAYGRGDAPFLWFMELKKGLEALGFIPSPFDLCAFILENHKTGAAEGAIGYMLTMGCAVVLRCFNRSFKHWLNDSLLDLTRNAIALSLDFELASNLTIPYTST